MAVSTPMVVLANIERRASRRIALILGTMIEQLIDLGPDRRGVVGGLAGVDRAHPTLAALRLTLRQAVATLRDVEFDCRLDAETVAIDQRVVPEYAIAASRPMALLVHRLRVAGAGSLQIDRGASAGELLLLARYLAQKSSYIDLAALLVDDIGTPLETILARSMQRGSEEPAAVDIGMLRTWSMALLPEHPAHTSPADISAMLQAVRAAGPGDTALVALRGYITAAVERRDALALETLAIETIRSVARVGTGAGRLGLEAVLRALLQPDVIRLIALRVPVAQDIDHLCAYFARAGKIGAATLLHAVTESPDALTRWAYVDALAATRVVPDDLTAALQHPKPEAVCAAVGLVGELGGTAAEQPLIGILRHPDARVRLAVVRGLVRLHTSAALAAVQTLLTDPRPEFRRLAALASATAATNAATSGSGVARPSAVPLLTALDVEPDAEVRLELVLALGRIASADAIQRLMRMAIAAPSSSDTRDAVLRITALEGLVRARGGQALSVIKTLESDPDAAVATAAKAHRSALPE